VGRGSDWEAQWAMWGARAWWVGRGCTGRCKRRWVGRGSDG